MKNGLSKSTNFLQEYGMYEYMLVINPDEQVKNKISEEKNSFAQKYNHQPATKGQPHITVANFLAREIMEPVFIKWIQRICHQFSSFDVTLNNYSGFPSHTIYLRVQNPAPFRLLAQQLKAFNEFLQASFCPPLQLVNHPHLTIARKLQPAVYAAAITDYSQKTFHETFVATELLLLRRAHQFDKCHTVNVFRFLPQRKVA